MYTTINTAASLLGIQGEVPENLSICAEIAVRQILSYCNLSILPDELEFTAAQLAAELYSDASGGSVPPGVSSVSEAGRTVSFDTARAQVSASQRVLERASSLNRFKRLYR